ncbi:ABC transporter permease [Saccharopolyspora sp. K220]|uniref:ABC transporter permease n=1 Tax=Saccharopolyspora soli TaxID=2926618 RepID=UPI001F5AB80C|nr:ABC transporter permease [Saccharopolyspora soli]MCI2423732.1 ABC transporter permease [Saccharopolyspora soli]
MANEFAKMRRLRVVPVAVVMVIGVLALSCVELTNPGFLESVGDASGQPWQRLLAGMTFGVPMLSPILLAVLASRPVDIEHQGNGWLFSQTSGMTPGYLCRIKFVAVGAVVVVATLVQSGLVFAVGKLVGITVAFPAGQWLGYTAAIVVVNLVLFALHLVLSARVDNQLLALGIGVLGVFFAVSSTGMPRWLAHFFPWGYYALATPVDYRDGALVSLSPSYLSVLALGVVGGALFLLITRLFDRREG